MITWMGIKSVDLTNELLFLIHVYGRPLDSFKQIPDQGQNCSLIRNDKLRDLVSAWTKWPNLTNLAVFFMYQPGNQRNLLWPWGKNWPWNFRKVWKLSTQIAGTYAAVGQPLHGSKTFISFIWKKCYKNRSHGFKMQVRDDGRKASLPSSIIKIIGKEIFQLSSNQNLSTWIHLIQRGFQAFYHSWSGIYS